MKNLNELAKEIHQNSIDKGFYQSEKDLINVLKVENYPLTGNMGRGIKHAFFAQKIALIHSELSKAIEADRMDIHSLTTDILEDIDFSKSFKSLIKNSVEDELADVIIRVLDLTSHLGIDIQKHVELKMKYNSLREYKHGKEY